MKRTLEYIWIDGQTPTSELRSKTKIIDKNIDRIEDIPEWSFDGSSTNQADGDKSDCILKPVYYCNNPFRGHGDKLVMCEVMNPDGTPHKTNKRANLVEVSREYERREPLFGIEQEYTLFENITDSSGGRIKKHLYGWPTDYNLPEQGRYYCGVGSDRVLGREIAEKHMIYCLNANLGITGINAEVMPSQWEFQVGTLGPLDVSDQLWVARWILHRTCEEFNAFASFEPKPLKGDWNGAGAHINYSTNLMRNEGGIDNIIIAARKLGNKHDEFIEIYGANNDERLTGKHETCSIDEFKYGVGDRGASIRIPAPVDKAGKGYLEDRRPAANVDPYEACAKIIQTTCR